MSRYLVLWESDESKIPVDPNVRRDAWLMAIEATKKDMKDGLLPLRSSTRSEWTFRSSHPDRRCWIGRMCSFGGGALAAAPGLPKPWIPAFAGMTELEAPVPTRSRRHPGERRGPV